MNSDDAETKDLKNEIKTFLMGEWIKDTYMYNVDGRVYDLLVERADVLTITFMLQHFRLKLFKHQENWELDCATASHLIEKFEDKIEQDVQRKVKKILESIRNFKFGLKLYEESNEFIPITTGVQQKHINESWEKHKVESDSIIPYKNLENELSDSIVNAIKDIAAKKKQ